MDEQLEQWKMKKIIKNLETARGNGTSMISLILPPKSKIADANRLLTEEMGTATNIKSRVNRLSVLSAIKSTQERLKLYKDCPPNGLVIYCGTILTEDNKEKKVTIDLEPFRPINTSLYLCDNRFHTDALMSLFEDDLKYGFIIMDGNGTLFGVLRGNTKTLLHKFTVELPKKHGRGGQSALRFARLRLEKRHNYLVKVAEMSVQMFITDNTINVSGLVLAGSAEFKNDLNNSDLFDNRLKEKVISTVDIAYGGEHGFNQAIELSSEILSNVKLVNEKKILKLYFDEIAQDTGKYCFGIKETMNALEQGCCEKLICWDELSINRYKLRNTINNNVKILYLNEFESTQQQFFIDNDTNTEMETIEKDLLLEWLIEHHKEFGTPIELISNKSSEGSQFTKGFGGIGAILRYQMDIDPFSDDENMNNFDDFDDFI